MSTDIDEESLSIAKKNVEMNNLENKITLKLVNDSNLMLDGVIPNDKTFDFCMCNPPFFADEEEATRTNPHTICTGTKNELETQGGEVEFIQRMIQDSLKLKEKICWYTTMLGKKKSLKELKTELFKQGIEKYYVTEFVQGKVTRWGLAWTFLKVDEVKISIDVKPKMYIKVNNHNLKEIFNILTKIFEKKCSKVKKEDYIGKIHGILKDETKILVNVNQIQKNQFILEVISQGNPSVEFQDFFKNISSSFI